MKKSLLALMLAVSLTVGGVIGCTNGDAKTESTSEDRTVTLDEIGLKYTTPDIWRKYEKTNIYPISTATEKTLAQIKYYYITEENLKAVSEDSSSINIESALKNICEIVVLKKENVENDLVKQIFAQYNKAEQAAEQGEYVYYVLSEYKGDISELTDKQKEAYTELSSAVGELTASISTYEFNPEDVKKEISEYDKYLTFDTKTLEGEKIASTVFADYKLTMVNFWGTYTYPDINESSILQEVYTKIKDNPDLNLISGVIDTPDTATEEVAKNAKSEAGGEYTSIVMDETLAKWVTSNLGGIPTTVFVNSDGKIVGEPLEGKQTTETYLSKMEELLKTME